MTTKSVAADEPGSETPRLTVRDACRKRMPCRDRLDSYVQVIVSAMIAKEYVPGLEAHKKTVASAVEWIAAVDAALEQERANGEG